MTPIIPKDLARDPELAAIEILDAVLDTTIRALIAAHPEITDSERPYWLTPPPPSCHAACSIVGRAARLRDRLADYRSAVDAESSAPLDTDAEFPF